MVDVYKSSVYTSKVESLQYSPKPVKLLLFHVTEKQIEVNLLIYVHNKNDSLIFKWAIISEHEVYILLSLRLKK